MNGKTIIALDFPGEKEALDFLKGFEKPVWVKVGMELFYAAGPEIVSKIKALGHKVFLDLKVCDIPNTVKGAMRDLAAYGADMVDCLAMGGKAMMEAALKGLEEGSQGKPRPKLIAVTVLTSLDKEALNNEIGVPGETIDEVGRLANLAKEAGLDGVVCSPYEASTVKERCGAGFLAVTPGIRFASDSKGDQKRVATPGFAKQQGADMIVVGRSITKSEDPKSAYERAEKEMED